MKMQVTKNYNVSNQSPFDKNHSPPPGYTIQDTRVTLKPTRINPNEIETNNIPLAGHLTEIGNKILTLGSKKAKFVTTMDWGLGAQSDSC